jgi:hypothetical protein
MSTQAELNEYQEALRAEVCSRCIERRPNAPPCAPLGKGCGIEQHLEELIEMCRTTDSALIDPYIDKLHDAICPTCKDKDTSSCPCPLDYLLQLAVETVEKVQQRQTLQQP